MEDKPDKISTKPTLFLLLLIAILMEVFLGYFPEADDIFLHRIVTIPGIITAMMIGITLVSEKGTHYWLIFKRLSIVFTIVFILWVGFIILLYVSLHNTRWL